VTLFVQRARAIRPSFQLDAETAPIVAEICIRLDGLPLAIELATAQLKLFTPQQLRKRLGVRLDALKGGPRDVPERQKTLRNTIAWSHQLLGPSERQLFALLSVFRGGWTVAAAEEICWADGTSDVVGDLSALLNKSLVQRSDDRDAETRFTMLETIREYATEQLIAAGTRPAIRSRHALYYRDLVERADRPLRGGPYLEMWLAMLEREHDNLRAALHWSLGGGDIETGLKLVGGLGFFWFRAGHHQEGRRWTLLALDKSEGASERLRAGVTMAAGRMAFATHDRARGKRLDQEALALYRHLGDGWNSGWALCLLASDGIGKPDEYEASLALCEEGVAILEALGDRPGVAQGLNIIGELARLQGDLDRAQTVYEECLDIAQAIEDRMRQVMMYQNLGTILERLGNYRRAQSLLEEGLRLAVRLNDGAHIATCLASLAGVTPAQPERAARLIGAANALFAEIGIIPMLGDQPEHDRIVDRVRQELDEATYTALVAEGAALAREEAVRYALESEAVS
jgi:non-specific serine/threonine protein kinase